MKLFTIALTAYCIGLAYSQPNPIENTKPTTEYLPPVAAEAASTPLTQDGYQYPTVKRLKYRHRREAPSPSMEYLPPPTAKPSVDYLQTNKKPSAEYLPPTPAGNVDTPVADDGYRYKTIRRLKVRRQRREAPTGEYLPPIAEPTMEYLPPVGTETPVDNSGYHYRTVRRLRLRTHRHRRDVSELTSSLPSAEYLPPVEVELAPDVATVLDKNGYRYKTVRHRLRFRRRRREAEVAAEATAEAAADGVDTSAVADTSADKLAPISNVEYLPPSNAAAEEEPAAVKSAELAQDGYRYKTVRRLRYRHRQ